MLRIQKALIRPFLTSHFCPLTLRAQDYSVILNSIHVENTKSPYPSGDGLSFLFVETFGK